MALHRQDFNTVPDETARVALAAFPNDNPYLILRDKLGVIYQDRTFAPLFASSRGRPAESPGRLALVTALQFAENLSDRQAADAVRGRIDWKYLLGLELTDPGFHYSLLCDFRKRVLESGTEQLLLDTLLQVMREHRLIKERGKQRSDSTHVLAAIRDLNRLECVGETLRYALNSLAVVVPEWLRAWVPVEWYERYGEPFEQWRLPEKREDQQQLAIAIGQDGYQLWRGLCASDTQAWLRDIPALETFRRVWVQEFYAEAGQVFFRQADQQGLPPAHVLISSPYDPEARYSIKRRTEWCGYKVHLTETCEDDRPLLITAVETTLSTTPDVSMTEPIHLQLQQKDLLPRKHFVDAGYVDARSLAESPSKYGVELIGPAPADSSWQARERQGFDSSGFVIDWDQLQAICPQGRTSASWSCGQDRHDEPVIHIRFAKAECQGCSVRAQCTRSETAGARTLTLRPQEQHLALQNRRQCQTRGEFQKEYARRAGIEGTLSQGTRRCGLRRSRYRGLTKTHLQHVCTAIAINLVRLADWFAETPRAQTRCSRFAALSPA